MALQALATSDNDLITNPDVDSPVGEVDAYNAFLLASSSTDEYFGDRPLTAIVATNSSDIACPACSSSECRSETLLRYVGSCIFRYHLLYMCGTYASVYI